MHPFDAILIVIGAAFAVGCCAAALTFAVAVTCRWLNWAPVNINVTFNDYRNSAED